MKKKMIIKINKMACMHCAKTITETLEKQDNILKVKVDLKKKEALIIYKDNLDIDLIKNIINDLDYEFVEAIPC